MIKEKISVIVPTYHRPEQLRRCLESLAQQTRKPDEVIVVMRDTDAMSQDMVTQLRIGSKRFSNTKAISVHKSGQVSALNAGLDEARGNITCFTDDDAEANSDWIERIERHFRDPTIAGVGGRDIIIVNGKSVNGICKVVGKMFWFGKYIGNHHLKLERGTSVEVDLLKGVNMAFRSSYLDAFRFDENLDEQTSSNNETDLCFSLKKKGGKIMYDPLLMVNHYVVQRFAGAKREDLIKNIYNYSHNYTYVILKHFPWYQKIAFLVYIFLVGQRSSWGLLTTLIYLIKGKITWRGQAVASIKGKIDGIETYIRWRRDSKEV